jgi:hypothetical protein
MGRRKSKSLLKEGFKRPSKKFWVNTGFGTGHYMYRSTLTLNDGSTARLCESKDGIEQWEHPVKTLTLDKFGLRRNEYGRIVPK